MYVTVLGHDPDPLVIIDMILTGFIDVDKTNGRFVLLDDAYHTQLPEAMMLFDQ